MASGKSEEAGRLEEKTGEGESGSGGDGRGGGGSGSVCRQSGLRLSLRVKREATMGFQQSDMICLKRIVLHH